MSRLPAASQSFCHRGPRPHRNFPLPKPWGDQTKGDLDQNYFLACLENGVDPLRPVLSPVQFKLVFAALIKLQYQQRPREGQLHDGWEVELDACQDFDFDEAAKEEELDACQDFDFDEAAKEVELELTAWELKQSSEFSEALCLCRATSTKRERSAHGKVFTEEIWGMSRQALAQYRAATRRKCLELLETHGRDAALAYFVARLVAALRRRNDRLARQSPRQLDLDLGGGA